MNPTTTERADRVASAQSRSQLFWLLADALLNGPRAESWPLIKDWTPDGDGDMADPLNSAWQNLVDVARHLDPQAQERLAVEHTRLFAGLKEGSGPPPPFESAWRAGHEPGTIALAVTRAYAEAGFADIDVDAGPQDHLAVELKFMAMLALREAEAWRQDDPVGVETRIRQQRAFLDHHLLEWVPRWTDALAQQTDELLFLAIAGLLWIGLVRAAEELRMPIQV